jgi:hypothetical protein
MADVVQVTALTRLSTATRMLSEARNLDEVRQIRDMAEAARAYAKAADLGDEAIGYATAIKLDAERKAGDIVAKMERAKPGQADGSGRRPSAPTLADLGVTKSQSSRWQALARMPEPAYQELRERVRSRARAADAVPVSQVITKEEDELFGKFQSDEDRRRAAATSLISDLRQVSMRASQVLQTATAEERDEIAVYARTILNDAVGRGRRPEVVR